MNFLLTTALPLLGVLLTALLLAYGVYVLCIPLAAKPLLPRRVLRGLCVAALLCDATLCLRFYLAHSARQTWADGAVYRASRERFTLPYAAPYGELVIPAGSLVNRKDPFDDGAPTRPLALHGLEAVRFAQPVQVAGAWASALQLIEGRVELAQDQTLGPLYRFDDAGKRWVPHPLVPALACKKGQIAVFQVPHIPFDVQAALDTPPPDGALARLRPSEWLLRGCENGPPIAVLPAAARPAPAQ